MVFDKDKLLAEVLQNERVNKRAAELKLTKEQLYEALPVMLDMSMQVEGEKYLIDMYITPNGMIQRTQVLSELGKKEAFRENIVTLDIHPVDFNEGEEYFKDAERKLLVSEFAKFLAEPKPTKGLYIYGQMGVGKSFTVKRFAKKLAEAGNKVGIVSVPELVGKVKGTFGINDKYELLHEKLKNVEYLFIDDIGAEAISAWFRDEFLFSILNTRMDKGLTTFFTSNYNYDDLAKMEARTANQKYRDLDKAERLLTRVRTLTKPVLLKGKNRRY